MFFCREKDAKDPMLLLKEKRNKRQNEIKIEKKRPRGLQGCNGKTKY